MMISFERATKERIEFLTEKVSQTLRDFNATNLEAYYVGYQLQKLKLQYLKLEPLDIRAV